MSATTKNVLTFTLIAFLVISFAGVASAKKKQGAVWYGGTVTKAAWTEGKVGYIEVDDEQYWFLPDGKMRVTRQYKTAKGQWTEENLSLSKVYVGSRVLILFEGMQIYQLIVEEK